MAVWVWEAAASSDRPLLAPPQSPLARGTCRTTTWPPSSVIRIEEFKIMREAPISRFSTTAHLVVTLRPRGPADSPVLVRESHRARVTTRPRVRSASRRRGPQLVSVSDSVPLCRWRPRRGQRGLPGSRRLQPIFLLIIVVLLLHLKEKQQNVASICRH